MRIHHLGKGLAVLAFLLLGSASIMIPAINDLREPGANLETLVTIDKGFMEGPVYSDNGFVYFSDILNNHVMRYDVLKKGGGGAEVFRDPSGRSNGLAFDLQGRLLACEGNMPGGNRRVTRAEKDGSVTVLADRYEGKRLNSPNDVDVDARERIYFTDPRYGDRSDIEQDKDGVYRIDPSGTITRIIGDLERPNGLAVSADQKTLYVVDDDNSRAGGSRKVYAFQLRPDGSAGDRRVFHDFGTGRGGDGMTLDERGNVYIAAGLNIAAPPAEDATVKGGIYVFTPEGKQIDFIPVPADLVTNVAFGDRDLKTLYITSGPSLFRIRMNVRGYVLWPSTGSATIRK